MSLKPLNPHVSANDPIVLNLMAQVAKAADKVRNSGRRSAFESADIARLAAHDGITTSAWTAKILAAVRSLRPRLELPTP